METIPLSTLYSDSGFSREDARQRLEELRKKAVIGDIVSPIGEQWEAQSTGE